MRKIIICFSLFVVHTGIDAQSDSFVVKYVVCSPEFYGSSDYNVARYLKSSDFNLADGEPRGTSTVDYSKSNNPFSKHELVNDAIGSQIDHIRSQLDPQLVRLANEFRENLKLFDVRNFDAAKNVREMQLEINGGTKIPKVLQSYRQSISEYQKLESLSQRLFEYSRQPSGVPMKYIRRETNQFMNAQIETLKQGDFHFKAGNEIISYAKNEKQIMEQSRLKMNAKNRLSLANAAKLEKIKSDIAFSQKQIRTLMKGQTELSKIDELTRSKVLAVSATIALFLKSAADLVYETLSAITENSKLAAGIDIGKAFIEKLMEENIANGKPLAEALELAEIAAYVKIVVQSSSTHSFPLDKLVAIPQKISSIVDNVVKWDDLNKDQTKLNRAIKEQLSFIDNAIKFNERAIQRANAEAERLIKQESKEFLKKPF